MDRWSERKKTRVTGVTHHHRLIWSAASRLISEADELPQHKWYGYLAGLLLSSFAFEGLLNYIGEELYPKIWADPRATFGLRPYRGTAGKLRFLAEQLAVPIDRSRRPYQSFSELVEFRNQMVHVRHETIDTELVTSIEEVGRTTDLPPIAAHEPVHRIISDLEELGDSIFEAAVRSGLPRAGGSKAFGGTVSSREYHDLP